MVNIPNFNIKSPWWHRDKKMKEEQEMKKLKQGADVDGDGISYFITDTPEEVFQGNWLEKKTIDYLLNVHKALVNKFGEEDKHAKKVLYTAMRVAAAKQSLLSDYEHDLGKSLKEYDLNDPELLERIKTFAFARPQEIIYNNAKKEKIILDPESRKFLDAYRNDNVMIFSNPHARYKDIPIQDWPLTNMKDEELSEHEVNLRKVFRYGYGELDENNLGNKINMYLNFDETGIEPNIMKAEIELFDSTAVSSISIKGEFVDTKSLYELDERLLAAIVYSEPKNMNKNTDCGECKSKIFNQNTKKETSGVLKTIHGTLNKIEESYLKIKNIFSDMKTNQEEYLQNLEKFNYNLGKAYDNTIKRSKK